MLTAEIFRQHRTNGPGESVRERMLSRFPDRRAPTAGAPTACSARSGRKASWAPAWRSTSRCRSRQRRRIKSPKFKLTSWFQVLSFEFRIVHPSRPLKRWPPRLRPVYEASWSAPGLAGGFALVVVDRLSFEESDTITERHAAKYLPNVTDYFLSGKWHIQQLASW